MSDIELIVKIDADVYTRLFDNGRPTDIADGIVMERALRLGKPLPKGHGKIVDIDKLIDSKCNECGHLKGVSCTIPCYAVRRMLDADTIIEADKAESEE